MTIKHSNFGSIIAKLIAAAMLFAALGRQTYDYYTLVRCVACGVAGFTAFQAAQIKKFGWLFVFAIAAVMLNPIAPLHLKRVTWGFVDATVAMLLLVSIAVIELRKIAILLGRFFAPKNPLKSPADTLAAGERTLIICLVILSAVTLGIWVAYFSGG